MAFEKQATTIHNYETMVVPGLLQTAEYMRAIVCGSNPELTDGEIERFVSVRMGRQTLLHKQDSPLLRVLVEESVLHRPTGGAKVMEAQLRHVAELSRRNRVITQVVPQSVGAHPGLAGPFMILEFRTTATLVYLEQRGNSAFLEESGHVAVARHALRRLCAVALSPDDSIQLIVSIANGLSGK